MHLQALHDKKCGGKKHTFLHTKIFLLKRKVENCVSRHMEKEWTHSFINVSYCLLVNYNQNISQDGQHTYNETLGHVPATIVAVEKP